MLKAGTWSSPPAGLDANNENLRSMLVNPNDLVAGTGETTSVGNQASPPVHRLLSGRRYPLPAPVGTPIGTPQAQQATPSDTAQQ